MPIEIIKWEYNLINLIPFSFGFGERKTYFVAAKKGSWSGGATQINLSCVSLLPKGIELNSNWVELKQNYSLARSNFPVILLDQNISSKPIFVDSKLISPWNPFRLRKQTEASLHFVLRWKIDSATRLIFHETPNVLRRCVVRWERVERGEWDSECGCSMANIIAALEYLIKSFVDVPWWIN